MPRPDAAHCTTGPKLTLLPLVFATYFMVSGGPYGLEDVVSMAGYTGALLILLITPLVWSVPSAMMVGELASAIPEEGGFYIWVNRGLGKFWGFQEVWLTMVGSIFEMALYPTLFVDYLGHFAPAVTDGWRGYAIGFAMIAICTWWNIRGAKSVGDSATLMSLVLFAPFVALVFLALVHKFSNAGAAPAPLTHVDILGGILVAMWNYMGWDNTSTIAGEVDHPQKTYPRVMWICVTLVTVTYLIPVAAVARAHMDPNSWTTGGWVDAGRLLGGGLLAGGIAIGGIVSSIGTFNALMMSFSRLPLVMAEQNALPKVFARCHPRTGAPWVAIVVCAVGWAACMFLGFERLIILDVLVTGLSIMLEFWALIGLRVREPRLARPYRVPGGIAGTILIGLPPLALMIAAGVRNHSEQIGSLNALWVGMMFIVAGLLLYWLSLLRRNSVAHI
jgi:amino acid transporter